MNKSLEKILEDYKYALQMLDDYDHGRLSKQQLRDIRREQEVILADALHDGAITHHEYDCMY